MERYKKQQNKIKKKQYKLQLNTNYTIKKKREIQHTKKKIKGINTKFRLNYKKFSYQHTCYCKYDRHNNSCKLKDVVLYNDKNPYFIRKSVKTMVFHSDDLLCEISKHLIITDIISLCSVGKVINSIIKDNLNVIVTNLYPNILINLQFKIP